MKCPHCGTEMYWGQKGECGRHQFFSFGDWPWVVEAQCCPACHKPILQLQIEVHPPVRSRPDPAEGAREKIRREMWPPEMPETLDVGLLLYPKRPYRAPCPKEVPDDVAADYNEACDVIDISPTAAAALARRCMQLILVNEAGAPKSKNLKQQVEAVVNDQNTPEHVKSDLDDLRNIGNFSAHANEDLTGQVLRALPDEAEWTLETLRTLFEHYYVAPAKSKARKAALKAKLAKKQ